MWSSAIAVCELFSFAGIEAAAGMATPPRSASSAELAPEAGCPEGALTSPEDVQKRYSEALQASAGMLAVVLAHPECLRRNECLSRRCSCHVVLRLPSTHRASSNLVMLQASCSCCG